MKHLSTISAIIAALGIVWLWTFYDDAAKRSEPSENWFVVRNIYVADFEEGNVAPPVVYDREIRRPFDGTWHAEIHPVGRQETVCRGTGSAFYEPKDELPKSGVTLDWYLDKKCDLPPGQYVLNTHWTIKPTNYPEKEMAVSSNVFNVIPRGAQLYLTPEQSTILQSIAPE